MKKQILGVVLFFTITTSSHAQFFTAYLPKVKCEIGAASSVNLGLSFINYDGDNVIEAPVWGHRGPLLETGLTIGDQKHYMQNKIGYEYFFLIFGARLNFVHYTDFTSNQFAVRPEIGLSLFSFLTFTYGYQMNIDQPNLGIKNGSIYSLNFAYFIDRKKFRD